MAVSYVLEGPEGAGKSLVTALSEELIRETTPFPVLRLYEPGTAKASLFIREALLKGSEFKDMDPMTCMFLYSAARNETYQKVILPFKKENPNGITIADRSWWSTLVYQVTDGVDESYAREIQAPFMDYPDKVFLIDVPVEESLLRIEAGKNNGRQADWRDERAISVFEENRSRYHKLANEYHDKTEIINGFQNPWITAFRIRQSALIDIAEDERYKEAAMESIMSFTRGDLEKYSLEKQESGVADLLKHVESIETARHLLGASSVEVLQRKMYEDWEANGLINFDGEQERKR